MNGTTERELAEHAARLLASPNRPPLSESTNSTRPSIVSVIVASHSHSSSPPGPAGRGTRTAHS